MIRSFIQQMAEPVAESVKQIRQTAADTTPRSLRRDAVAGLTVAVIAVPQAMAYAVIAGVPPEYGLYTLIFQCAIGSIFNSQPLLSVGPINTQSLLVASIVGGIDGIEVTATEYVGLVVTLTFLKGLLQMAMAALHLGNLVRYVSQSVIIGFTAGAGVLIAAKQLSGFFGFSAPRVEDPWPGLIGVVQQLWGHFNETSMWALGLGLVSLALVIGSRRISRFVPGPLIAVGVSAGAVWWFGLTSSNLTLVGEVPTSLLGIVSLPDFIVIGEHFDALVAGALALSLLGLMEAYSIGKNIATKTGTRISANQELFVSP